MKISAKTIGKLTKDERSCLRLIRYFKFSNHRFQCRKCDSENEKRQDDPVYTKCADCGNTESLTANTIFHRRRKPLTELMRIILSVVIDGGKSALQVTRETGLWYSTVWEWQQKARNYFVGFFSPDDTQSVHYSFLLAVLFRRTTESTPESSDGKLNQQSPQTDTVSTAFQNEKNGDEIHPHQGQDSAPVNDEQHRGQESASLNNEQHQGQESAAVNDKQHQGQESAAVGDDGPTGDVIPEPLDIIGVCQTIGYIAKIFHSGVGCKHGQAYTAQFNFITYFPEQVEKFLAACIRAAPKQIERSDYLTLPVIALAGPALLSR